MYKKYFKRIIDTLGAVILLIIFFPIYTITIAAIIFDSEGPVLADVPERTGMSGKKFKMYKFRSMVVNAHQIQKSLQRIQARQL